MVDKKKKKEKQNNMYHIKNLTMIYLNMDR